VTPNPDEIPAQRPRDDQPPHAAPNNDDAVGQVAFDAYGLKVRVPAPELAPFEVAPVAGPPDLRTWRSVWRDCLAYLQETVVGLFSLVAAIPRGGVHVIEGIGTTFQSAGEFTRRVARGRARADHQEDERIAESESNPTSSDPSEKAAAMEKAIARLDDLRERIQSRGGRLDCFKTEDGKIIFQIVDIDAQQSVLDYANTKLLETTPLLPQSGEPTTTDDLNSILPPRVANLLRSAGISTRAQLGELTADDVLQIRGIGARSLEILQPYLHR
jgi:hypothetical protein